MNDAGTITAKIFDIKSSVESGQPLAFHADYNWGNVKTVKYSTSRGIIELISEGNVENDSIIYRYSGNYTLSTARSEVSKRFGLSVDMESVYSAINTDKFIMESISIMPGLRVTHNDEWETTLCFLVSQFNNIKRIRGIIRKMKEKFGDEAPGCGKLFPSPESIAAASIGELLECGTGFRAKYIKKTADRFADGEFSGIRDMVYEDAKARLMEFDGIGEKVADCILLFGYGKLEAFPVDTWIKRIMERIYIGRKCSIKEIHRFAERKWGSYAGYAQQYIYWHGRSNGV